MHDEGRVCLFTWLLAAREATPKEDKPEYALIDHLDSRRLGVQGEGIQNGTPRLINWIVFLGKSIYVRSLNNCTSNPVGSPCIPSCPIALPGLMQILRQVIVHQEIQVRVPRPLAKSLDL